MIRPSKTMEKTGFRSRHINLLSYPTADYRSSNYREAVDMFDHSLGISQSGDFHALQVIVRDVLKAIPEGEEVSATLLMPTVAVPGFKNWPGFVRCQVVVSSIGEIVCVLKAFSHITLGFEDAQKGRPVPVIVQIWLRGAPVEQAIKKVSAKQQMDLMHKMLASKLSADFDGLEFHDLHDSAKKIADMVHGVKSELEEQLIVDTVTVEVSKWAEDATSTNSAQQDVIEDDADDDAVYEAEEELAAPVLEGFDYPAVESIDPIRPSENANGGVGSRPDTHVHMSSAGNNMPKDAVAIRALLQELDSKLHALMSNFSTDSVASKGTTISMPLDSAVKSGAQMQRGVVVALGSNVGNRIEEIEKACRAIDADPDMRIVDTSFLYETKPMYVEDQGSFVNGACEVSGDPVESADRLPARC